MAVLQRHKSNIYGLQEDLNKIGDLTTLTTTNKTNLVSAINELDSQLDTTALTTTNKTIVGAINEHDIEIGDLSTLTTTNKSNLVSAVNELNTNKLSKASNLSDLTNTATARTNLDVYSKSEVITEINQAGLNLGTNFSADDAADATTKFPAGTLSIGDNIFLSDDSDGKWAIYKVIAITDGAYSTSTLEKIMDEDVYLNAQSAAAIKSAYESNANTNAFTDVAKNKVQLIAITTDIDLDKVVQNDELYTDQTFTVPVTDLLIPSAKAVKNYVLSKTSSGITFITENLTVTSDKITLTYEPKNGVVFNFATVRYIDSNFVSYDIPITVTATPGNKEFLLSPDSSGQFDGKTVTVQYSYATV